MMMKRMARTLMPAVAIAVLFPGSFALAQGIQLVDAFPKLTFTQPDFLTHSNDGTNRIFVVQQNGIIRVFPNDSAVAVASTFLDIGSKLSSSSGEEGLLGLAFHPKYASNGYFYVDYTEPNPRRTVVARYSVSQNDPNVADPFSEYRILEIYQPYSNHNGGMLMFGDDGYLYIGMGDGGSGGDPQNRAQNLDSLLGKILRINVDTVGGTTRYGIPGDNPLIGNGQGFREEIYAWGLRNPWRFSQDPVTRQTWVGDVGQNAWEEIDLLEKGRNYGWRIMEGFHCYNPPSGCDTTGLTMPLKEYPHAAGNCSVTAGYIYRGQRRPDLVGAYIYGDYCTGRIWILRYQGGRVTADSLLTEMQHPLSSFGVDQSNELYLCNYDGSILRFAGALPASVGDPAEGAPHEYALAQNYPNPFNPTTNIKFQIPSTSSVTLRIYDILGREVATLVNEVKQAGTYTVQWQPREDSSGTYFYQLRTPGQIVTRKMVVTR